MAPRSRFDSLRTAEDQGTVGRARDARGDGDAVETPNVACCGASEETSRLIGSGVRSRFRVIFDYPRRRMILERPTD
jgi:hypothetical protein